MKRILKWASIALVVLSGLILLTSVGLYFIGMEKLGRSYPNIAVEPVKIPTDADAIARGKHIATIWACTRCHGDNLGGTLITNDPLSGQVPLLGSIPASNLTPGKGGVGKSYGDADWVRAIRHGVKPNGRAEVLMNDYSTMSDHDLGDLIVYLKQISLVDSDPPATSYGPIVPIVSVFGLFTPAAERIDHRAPRPADPVPGATKEYGSYLTAVCAGCHGALTAGMIRNWTQPDFIRTFKSGVLPNGKNFGSTMSSKTFRELNDMELSALWLYSQNTSSAQAR